MRASEPNSTSQLSRRKMRMFLYYISLREAIDPNVVVWAGTASTQCP